VDRFVRRVEQKIGDVIGALLVVEAGFLAVEGKRPEGNVFTDGVARGGRTCYMGRTVSYIGYMVTWATWVARDARED
jgi:hypothetical protein